MTFLLIFLVVTIGIPLVVFGYRRNLWTLFLSFGLPLVFVFVRNRMICDADRMSEACTWAYWAYAVALVVGCVLYLLATIIQSILGRVKARRAVQDNF